MSTKNNSDTLYSYIFLLLNHFYSHFEVVRDRVLFDPVSHGYGQVVDLRLTERVHVV